MNSINDTILWIFIGIGFAGALGLTTAAIFNLWKCWKDRHFKHVDLRVALAFTAANLMFFTYSLGISLINVNTIHFWNSAPTWIGNLIPLFINGFMVAGKIVENKRIRNNQTKISSK